MVDYAAISKKHETEYGTKVGKYGETLSEQLYSNATHFIFELLQNAEDAEAKAITFTLYANRLEVQHDGKAFDESDVESICSIKRKTQNTADMTKIANLAWASNQSLPTPKAQRFIRTMPIFASKIMCILSPVNRVT